MELKSGLAKGERQIWEGVGEGHTIEATVSGGRTPAMRSGERQASTQAKFAMGRSEVIGMRGGSGQ